MIVIHIFRLDYFLSLNSIVLRLTNSIFSFLIMPKVFTNIVIFLYSIVDNIRHGDDIEIIDTISLDSYLLMHIIIWH